MAQIGKLRALGETYHDAQGSLKLRTHIVTYTADGIGMLNATDFEDEKKRGHPLA